MHLVFCLGTLCTINNLFTVDEDFQMCVFVQSETENNREFMKLKMLGLIIMSKLLFHTSYLNFEVLFVEVLKQCKLIF